MDENVKIGTVMRSERKKKKIELEYMAFAVGVTVARMYDIESNKVLPSKELLKKIAAVLGIHVIALLSKLICSADFKLHTNKAFLTKAEPIIDDLTDLCLNYTTQRTFIHTRDKYKLPARND